MGTCIMYTVSPSSSHFYPKANKISPSTILLDLGILQGTFSEFSTLSLSVQTIIRHYFLRKLIGYHFYMSSNNVVGDFVIRPIEPSNHEENMPVKCIPPQTQPFYSKTWICRGIPNFLVFDPKHRMWVLVRIASPYRCGSKVHPQSRF